MTHDVIAVVPPGLEAQAAAELESIGALDVQPLRRAVRCRLDLAGLYRAHLRCRLPFRLLYVLASFGCSSREQLYAGVQRAVDWSCWLPPSCSFRVEVSGTVPGLNHSHYSALEVKNALVDWQRQELGDRSDVELEQPDRVLHLHLGQGSRGPMATLCVAGSSESLHRRGYRAAMGLAPLKENLAAGLIDLTGWDGSVPLLDPFCGSGTLLIEAAARALKRPPGLLPGPLALAHHAQARPFSCLDWPGADQGLWRAEVVAAAEAAAAAASRPLAPVIGWELDAEVLEQARSNVKAADLEPWIALQQGDGRQLEPPEQPGIVVCNPPYGARLGEQEDLRELYFQLGQQLKQRFSGWTLWLLSGNPELTRSLGMKASRRVPVSNGGIDCRWLRYEIR
jgi:putative N6-adenine-specific DNA methylase